MAAAHHHNHPRVGSFALAAFAVLVGSLAAVASGYSYVAGSLNELLPLIFRAIDSDYLINDFYVNSTAEFGIRFYYVRLIALAAAVAPVEAIYPALVLLSYAGVSLVTVFAVRDVTGSSVGAMIAASASAAIIPFHLGNDAALTFPVPNPARVAMPFCLLALWFGIRGKPTRAALISVPAIAIHAVLGVEAGAIALTAALARRLIAPSGRSARLRALAAPDLIRASAVLAGAAAALWIIPASLSGALAAMETSDFTRIYVYGRHPHHLVPSSWPPSQHLTAAAFAFAAAIALARFLRESPSQASGAADGDERRARAAAVCAIAAALALGFFAGWFFVEVVPVKWAGIAQFFRLIKFATWLGWMFAGWAIADALARREWNWSALGVACLAVPGGMLAHQSLSYAAATYSRLAAAPRRTAGCMLFALAAGLSLWAYSVAPPLIPRGLLPFAAGAATAFAIAVFPRLIRPALGALAAALALTLATIAADRFGDVPDAIAGAVRQPVLTLEEWRMKRERESSGMSLAMMARTRTEPDALFLIPDWRDWRLLTERAVVVDWKGFPFSDDEMLEWDNRWSEIFQRSGYPYGIDEAGLLGLWEKYRFDYAVLPADMDVSFPEVGSDDWHKIVRMPDVPP